jgi:hypothetical protein
MGLDEVDQLHAIQETVDMGWFNKEGVVERIHHVFDGDDCLFLVFALLLLSMIIIVVIVITTLTLQNHRDVFAEAAVHAGAAVLRILVVEQLHNC